MMRVVMTRLVILPPCLGDDGQVSKEGSACGVHVMVHMVQQGAQIHVLLYLHDSQQCLLQRKGEKKGGGTGWGGGAHREACDQMHVQQ